MEWNVGHHTTKCGFKFFNMWDDHSEFNGIIQNGWEVEESGSTMFQVCRKLQNLKQPLRKLNKVSFADIDIKEREMRTRLLEIQEKLDKDPLNLVLQEEEAQYAKEYKEIQ
ncbi:hypothetical protein RIF29_20709 [Crotalaria pallida]|uniref:Uncharacterized protein n=1 Tax=Crotalaria pallida TaxID=3830 RepID=A0AAN9F354_CROPI